MYLARHSGLRREIALKILMRPDNPEERARFSREAKVASSLEHPGIVGCYDVGQDAERGYLYLALEYASGGTLARRLEGGPLPPADAVNLCVHLAEALAYAHDKGVLHRNLKTADILFDEHGRAVISDFGLATYASAPSLTGSGVLRGTPETLAPEQFNGGSVDLRVDVYALGVILYQMLTGRLPYESDDLQLLAQKINAGAPPPPSGIQDAISPAIEAVCLRAMALDPEDRFGDMPSFATALRASLSSSATERRPAVAEKPQLSSPSLDSKGSAPNGVSAATLIASASMITAALIGSALLAVSLSSEETLTSAPARLESPTDPSPLLAAATPKDPTPPAQPTGAGAQSKRVVSTALREIAAWNFPAAKEALERARETGGSFSSIANAESELALARAEEKEVTTTQRRVYRRELRGGAALGEVERLLERHPGSTGLRVLEAELLAVHGRYDESVRALDALALRDPSFGKNSNHNQNRAFLEAAAQTVRQASLRGSPPWKEWAPLEGGAWVQESPGQIRGAGFGLLEFQFAGLVNRAAGKTKAPYEVSVEIQLDCTLPQGLGGIVFGLQGSKDFLLVYLVHDLSQFDVSPERLKEMHAKIGDYPKSVRCAQMVSGRWNILNWAPAEFPDAGWTQLALRVEADSVTPRIGGKDLARIPLSVPVNGRVGVLKFYDGVVGFRDFRLRGGRR